MKENNHLPVFGIGPYLIGFIAVLSISAIMLSFENAIPNYPTNQILMAVIGVILIICGLVFWLSAVLRSRIDESIRNNQLVIYTERTAFAPFIGIECAGSLDFQNTRFTCFKVNEFAVNVAV